MTHFSRRDFLASLALLATPMLLPSPAFGRRKQKRVLVVGAGISGIYCANLLENKGFTVELLEASARPFGKLLGREVGGHRFDLGGQAFSSDMLRVKRLGKKYGITAIKRPLQTSFFYSSGGYLTGKKLDPIENAYEALDDKIQALFPKLDLPAERMRHQSRSVESWLKEQVLKPEVEEYFRSNFASAWCESTENTSFLHFLDGNRSYPGDEGESDFRFRQGMIGLVEALKKDTKAKIHLETPVDKVDASGTGVSVRSGEKTFSADYLVFALPPPQLRAISISGADTTQLLRALANFNGAAVRKVIVLYKTPFWAKKPTEGAFATPPGMFVMDNSDQEKGVHSLVVFLGGPAARAAPAKDEVCEKLVAALGKEAKEPLDYVEEAWLGSKYMTGGYASIRAPGSSGAEAIPSSLGTKLFLAGSDTSDEYPSYIEGALAAAERAANSIIKREGLHTALLLPQRSLHG